LSDDPKITIQLVRSLIAAQFTAWSSLDIRQVATSGWDNRTFHLGDEMLVRLPHTKRYAMQP
jgi:aminoglycoside phosphotransferase (APT) family kinase protein